MSSETSPMNGLEATACHPSMSDAHDGILAADLTTNAGANRGPC